MPSPPLIVVIDDEHSVRTALRRLLRSTGIAVKTFSGGAEFLNSLAEQRPDCAVLDLHMPGVTSLDVLAMSETISSRSTPTMNPRRILIILVSALAAALPMTNAFRFPIEGATPVKFRHCSRTGATNHFCPACGSTVYYVLDETPGNIGVKVGCFTDPTFPAPPISGFEEYLFPWAQNVAALPMPGGITNSCGYRNLGS